MQVHQWQLDEQFLRIALAESVSLVVPLAAFQINSVNKATTLWLLLDVRPFGAILEKEFKAQFVNSNLLLSRVVLHSAGEESLREEESTDPEHNWCTFFVPFIQECDTGVAVNDPGSQRFHREESARRPIFRDHVVENRRGHSVKHFIHNDFSEQGALHLDQTDFHLCKHGVVTDTLLEEHSIHGFLVAGWEPLLHKLKVKHFGSLSCKESRLLADDLLSGLALSFGGTGLHRNHRLKNFKRPDLICGDLSIVMKTKSFRLGVQRKILDVIDVVFFVSSWNTLIEA